eukprot:Sdes_comp18003_c0_seq1m7274
MTAENLAIVFSPTIHIGKETLTELIRNYPRYFETTLHETHPENVQSFAVREELIVPSAASFSIPSSQETLEEHRNGEIAYSSDLDFFSSLGDDFPERLRILHQYLEQIYLKDALVELRNHQSSQISAEKDEISKAEEKINMFVHHSVSSEEEDPISDAAKIKLAPPTALQETSEEVDEERENLLRALVKLEEANNQFMEENQQISSQIWNQILEQVKATSLVAFYKNISQQGSL